MDHVKQLRLSIEANGGLIYPLIVRVDVYSFMIEKDNVVTQHWKQIE